MLCGIKVSRNNLNYLIKVSPILKSVTNKASVNNKQWENKLNMLLQIVSLFLSLSVHWELDFILLEQFENIRKTIEILFNKGKETEKKIQKTYEIIFIFSFTSIGDLFSYATVD